jgi:inhibitor of growth protein 4
MFLCVFRELIMFVFCLSLEALINQTRQQTKYCLGLASQSSKKGNGNHYNNGGLDEEETIEKMRKEIESSQENALSLCTEKVLLARQAYDLVSYIFL